MLTLTFFFFSSYYNNFHTLVKPQTYISLPVFSVRIQVFSNSGIATILVIAYWKLKSSQDICLDSKESYIITSIVGGIIGHYSCSNGDTWSSELGVLSDEQPRLITTFKVRTFSAFFLNKDKVFKISYTHT